MIEFFYRKVYFNLTFPSTKMYIMIKLVDRIVKIIKKFSKNMIFDCIRLIRIKIYK